MNWLAHLYLSDPTPGFRIGNLLPDLAPGKALTGLPPDFRRGVEQHRRIDAFTDAHPTVRWSICRIPAPFRRFGGILTDMFYDHFLARDWSAFSPTPLADFAAEVYDSFEARRAEIPVEAYPALDRMKQGNWLCSYREIEGISIALTRMAARFRRPVPLAESIFILEEHYDSFHSDFMEFFPQLRDHCLRIP